MELRLLRYFVAVAEELNLSRAAVRLHLSQPPLTRQIRQLEKEVAARLFERNARGVELTDAGRLFLEDARNILDMVSRASERATSAHHGHIGRLHVAVFGSVMFDRLPLLLAQFRSDHPGVELVFHTMNKGDQIEALRQGRIHAGFSRLTANYPDIATQTLQHERLFVALPADHRLLQRTRLGIKDLAGCPLVLFASGPRPNFTDVVFSLFERHGLRPTLAQTVEDAVTGIALVAAGFGACLVPESAAYVQIPGVAFRALEAASNRLLDVNCIYLQDHGSPVTAEFVRAVQAFGPGGAVKTRPAAVRAAPR
ncbi:LysR family transcriptional regulator [Ramlibacter sp. AN1015]|uniref:LysR family transcriptional regulator n=1 Tax=Ramlibacter sp. AN1015 TaxID=3133428 RepID=UPI0030C5733C